MAIRPNPDGTVSVVDDLSGLPVIDGVAPDALGSLYTPPATPPPVNDARLAANDPVSQAAGQSVPPNIRDWVMGSQSASVPDAGGPKYGSHQPGVAASPQPARNLVGPSGSARAQPPAAPGAPRSNLPEPYQASPTSDAIRGLLLDAARPKGGVRVNKPERDVLKSFQVQQAPDLSEETKLEQQRAGVAQQRAAAEGGMLRSAGHEDIAANYEQQRSAAQQEIAGIRDQERQRDQIVGARMRELDMMGEELRSKRKGATNPDAYWEDKGELAHALSTIGNALYVAGASVTGADPMGLAKQIDAKIDRFNQAKRLEVELLGNEISEKRTQLGDVRKQFLSRDAADAATRALMNEAMAAETASMAEHYKSADAQATATQLIAAFQAQAAEARAAAELAEKDAVTQNWQHVEAQKGVVGGAPGGMDGILKMAKRLNIDPKDAIRVLQEGKMPISGAELDLAKAAARSDAHGRIKIHGMERQVRLPDGTLAYSNSPDKAAKAEQTITSLTELQANIQRMSDLAAQKAAGRWSPELESDLRVLVSDNRYLVKDAIAKEALTVGEKENFDPLAGEDIGKVMNYVSDKSTTERLNSIMTNRLNAEKRRLYADPEATKALQQEVESRPDK